MIDMVYLAQLDNTTPQVIQRQVEQKTVNKDGSKDDDKNSAEAYGDVRAAYISSSGKVGLVPIKKTSASVIGSTLGFKSGKAGGFYLNAAGYFSQNYKDIFNIDNENKDSLHEDVFNINKDSFIYLGEAALNYSGKVLEFKTGRIVLDTPFADADDIRMAPNSFEGAWADVNFENKFHTQLLYAYRWAGFDSQGAESQNQFKYLVDKDSYGMFAISLNHEFRKNSELSVWYYYIDGLSKITHVDITGLYKVPKSHLSLDYGAQATNISQLDDSNVDGNVFGAKATLNYRAVYLGGAYNTTLMQDGCSITDGYGGGPYYTSMDEATISAATEGEPGVNSSSYLISTGFSFEDLSLKDLSFEVVHGETDMFDFSDTSLGSLSFEFAYGSFTSGSYTIVEKDYVVTYELGEKFVIEGIYANYKINKDENYNRMFVRSSYSF